MLRQERLKSRNDAVDSVSISTLLLKEAKGMTIKDKLVLFSLKNTYLALRVISKVVLGKKKRDRLFIERGISFQSFLYKSIKLLGMNNLVAKVDVPRYGFQAYCRSEVDFHDFSIMTRHEHNLIKLFSPKEGDVVVDVGAHIGLYTIIASKRLGASGKVVAIEAAPSNFEMLDKNIKLNKLNNVITSNNLVYSRETDLVLAEYDRILSGVDGKSEIKNRNVTVHVNTLDNLLQQNGVDAEDVNWMKIDVEGAELEVLRGAQNILSKSKDISILIEIHGISHLYKPIIDILKSYNFKIEFEQTFGYKRQNMTGGKNVLLRKSV